MLLWLIFALSSDGKRTGDVTGTNLSDKIERGFKVFQKQDFVDDGAYQEEEVDNSLPSAIISSLRSPTLDKNCVPEEESVENGQMKVRLSIILLGRSLSEAEVLSRQVEKAQSEFNELRSGLKVMENAAVRIRESLKEIRINIRKSTGNERARLRRAERELEGQFNQLRNRTEKKRRMMDAAKKRLQTLVAKSLENSEKVFEQGEDFRIARRVTESLRKAFLECID